MSGAEPSFEEQVLSIAEEFAELQQLDFSRLSLAAVDAVVKDGSVELKRAAGAYLAEVIRRRSPVKLRWVEAKRVNAAWNDADNPYLLATPRNLVFAVLGKPFKDSESLGPFADKVQELCSREATASG